MKISQIKTNKKNPRFIKDEKFKKLVNSIKEFPKMMELRPIIVDEDNTVLGGNMRLKALKELNYTDIPDNWVKKASDLTDEEKNEFVVKDNVGFGDWDFEILANEFDAELLEDWGLELWADDDLSNQNIYNGQNPELELEKFMNAEFKRLFLVYDNDTFEKVVNWLNEKQEKYNLENHSQAILKIIENENNRIK